MSARGRPASPPAPRRLRRRELLTALPGDPGGVGEHWIRVHRPAMACRFSVTLSSREAHRVPAARAALDEIDALEARLSLFRDTSELSALNRRAGGEPVVTSQLLFGLLARCQALHRETGGAFDPTSTPLSRAFGFLARQGRWPDEDERAAARARVGMEHVRLDPAERSVRFAIPGVEINLGSVGKGFALDRIAPSLRRRGVRRALLGAGGSSVLGFGREEWSVALSPSSRTLGEARFRDAALATSGAGEQHFEKDGRRHGHVIDPRTGAPARGVGASIVFGDSAATADALATAFLVGGSAVARPFCDRHPGTLALLLLDDAPDAVQVIGAREGVSLELADGLVLAAGGAS
jgi:thiamine biosynthesis lipoprotein